MSQTTDNVITKNYSGKFGNQVVFRNRYGTSVMAKPPKKFSVAPTPTQIAHRQLFLKATIFAKNIHTQPLLKSKYAQKTGKGRSIYNLAVADFMKPPVVNSIDITNYTGHIGDMIIVDAIDNFEVKSVKVNITAPDGTLVEEGNCTFDFLDIVWKYEATVDTPAITGFVVTATAFDNPGHSGDDTVTVQ